MRGTALHQVLVVVLLNFTSVLCFSSPKLLTPVKNQGNMVYRETLEQKGVGGLLPKNSPALRSAHRYQAASIHMLNNADRFLSWAASQGIQFESLSLKSFDGIRGIGASSNLKADDVVLSVPESAVLRVLADRSSLPSQLEKENFVSEKVAKLFYPDC
jgi:hypothetical protein